MALSPEQREAFLNPFGVKPRSDGNGTDPAAEAREWVDAVGEWASPPAEARIPMDGFVRDYAGLFEPVTEAPMEFHLGGALACLSLAVGRDAWFEVAGKVNLNIYILLLGESTIARKSTSLRLANMLLRVAAKEHPRFASTWSLPTGTMSEEALIEHLAGNDRTLMMWDEFGSLLASTKAKTYAAGLREKLTEVHSCWQPGSATRSNPIEAGPCYPVVLAATTQSRFDEEMAAGDVESGFLGRFLQIHAGPAEKVLTLAESRRAGPSSRAGKEADPPHREHRADRVLAPREAVLGGVVHGPPRRTTRWFRSTPALTDVCEA
jgi:hypothetical protein